MKLSNHRLHPCSRVLLTISSLLVVVAAHAEGRFAISADGREVTDTQTRLIWQRCALGQNWDGKSCAGKPTKLPLVTARGIGETMTPAWRLPTRDELSSIVDKARKKPAIDAAAFPATPPTMFWAVRPDTTDTLNAWLVDFSKGKVFGNSRKGSYLVRLVRSS